METKEQILLCDADATLLSLMSETLRQKGWKVQTTTDAWDAIERLSIEHYDLVLIDANPNGCTAYDFLKTVRPRYPLLPVIVLSSRQSQEEIIEAYRLGCDDYVVKPFSLILLEWRMRALMRRTRFQADNQLTRFDWNGIVFDAAKQTLGTHSLSGRENDLLLLLCRQEGQIIDKHLILHTLWGRDDAFAARSLAVFMNRLRALLKGTQKNILCTRGKGYKLVSE